MDDELVEAYNKGIQNIINHQALTSLKTFILRQEAPWCHNKLTSADKSRVDLSLNILEGLLFFNKNEYNII